MWLLCEHCWDPQEVPVLERLYRIESLTPFRDSKKVIDELQEPMLGVHFREMYLKELLVKIVDCFSSCRYFMH